MKRIVRSFDFYEFVGILVPGSVLLVAIGYLFDIGSLNFLLAPDSFGGLGVHVLIAYVIGHLLQAVGNVFEGIYWKAWAGMPTDWPVTKPETNKFPTAIESVVSLCQSSSHSLSLDKWQSFVAQARSVVYASGRATRLQFFNGTYGMFRGLTAAGLIVGCFLWKSPTSLAIVYPILILVLVISLSRMHRFGVHYAKELFANIDALSHDTRN